MTEQLPAEINDLFIKGSKTYFNSSLFFPPKLRREVTILYAFVRKADNFVDQVTQDEAGFENFAEDFRQARRTGRSNDLVIQYFVDLESSNKFEQSWTDSFLQSMRQDLSKQKYETIKETEKYIYGSANVIGLFMARLMNLPTESFYSAEMLGKSMQYINFIRDIDEDQELGRNYFPQDDMKEFGLNDLSAQEASSKPKQFNLFVFKQLERYNKWQKEGEKGFRFIPRTFLIPIKTASDMYKWTGKQIAQNPHIVFERKVKPNKTQILFTGVWNYLTLWK